MPLNRLNLTEAWQMIRGIFRINRDTHPLDSVATIEQFVTTRAAYIAQTKLYGYVKTRMGTSYPEMFKNPELLESLNIAKMHMFAACLSDLTVFAVDRSLGTADISDPVRRAVAQRIFRHGLEENPGTDIDQFSADDAMKEFEQRLLAVDWVAEVKGWDHFTQSPKAIIRWAPIADRHKKHDVEYVENSVKFAWAEIRRQFTKRVRPDAVATDINQGSQAPTGLNLDTSSGPEKRPST